MVNHIQVHIFRQLHENLPSTKCYHYYQGVQRITSFIPLELVYYWEISYFQNSSVRIISFEKPNYLKDFIIENYVNLFVPHWSVELVVNNRRSSSKMYFQKWCRLLSWYSSKFCFISAKLFDGKIDTWQAYQSRSIWYHIVSTTDFSF